MQAAILAIGDEITLGQTVDTNSAWLSARLAELGVPTLFHEAVPDDLALITEAFRGASARADLVLATGGLGPTADDLTRPALADALGCGLELHQPSLERIARIFSERGRDMPAANACQAMRPTMAEALENPVGTAPGLRARLGRAEIVVMPGVPSEARAMFAAHVAPSLSGRSGLAILTRAIHTFGVGESAVAELLGPLMDRSRNPKVGTTVSGGVVSVRIRSEYAKPAVAAEKLEATVQEIRARLGDLVFGEDASTLQSVVAEAMKASGRTVAVAESCTGGLLAKMLTDLPGSSVFFRGGWVVYSNELKQSELGVNQQTLAWHGAVSEQVVREMALRARLKAGADFALAVSGIAGPTGGTADKPVGTVWIALAGPGPEVAAERSNFLGDREAVRDRAAKTALNMLRLRLAAGASRRP